MILVLAASAAMGLFPVIQLAAFAAALNSVVVGSLHAAVPEVLALLGSYFAQQVLAPWMPWLEYHLQAEVSYLLHIRYFSRYARTPYETLLRPEWAASAERARQALPLGHRPFVLTVSVVQSLITLAGFVVLLWHTSATAALVVVGTVVLIGVRQVVTGRRQSDLESSLAPERVREEYYRRVLTSTDLAAERSLFGYQPYILGLWRKVVGDLYERRLRFTQRAQVSLLAWQFGQLFFVASVYLSVVLLATRTIGSIVVAFQVVGEVLGRSNALMLEMRLLSDTLFHLKNYQRFVTSGAGPTDRGAFPAGTQPLVHELSVEGVTYTYPEETHPAVDDLTVRFRAGEVTGLVGANGCGKSTVCAILSGLLSPQEGQVLVDGVRQGDAQLRALVSVSQAHAVRFPTSLYENVAMSESLRVEVQTLVEGLLASTGGTILAPDYAGSVDLSGGQWQIVAIARAANQLRPVLILDEPTAALDPETEGRVLDWLSDLTVRRRLVTVLVSHRVSTVMRCDHVSVLWKGRVVQSGEPAELLATDGMFRDMYDQQVRLISDAASTGL
jgi:ATP-binding cassette subfamily B protein